MIKFFTSDLHLGHKNVITYCNRPFKTVEHMNEQLIRRINERAHPDDVLIHVGDFACYGRERGQENNRTNPKSYLEQINPQIIPLKGNHDVNNKVKYIGTGMIMSIGKIGVITISHHPTTDPKCPEQFRTKGNALGYHICGHVHQLWKHYYDKEHNKLNINVGIDVWNYNIVSEQELINYIIKTKRELGL